jgi:hypothetical protein
VREGIEKKVLLVDAEAASSILDRDDNPHYFFISPALPIGGIMLG